MIKFAVTTANGVGIICQNLVRKIELEMWGKVHARPPGAVSPTGETI